MRERNKEDMNNFEKNQNQSIQKLKQLFGEEKEKLEKMLKEKSQRFQEEKEKMQEEYEG